MCMYSICVLLIICAMSLNALSAMFFIMKLVIQIVYQTPPNGITNYEEFGASHNIFITEEVVDYMELVHIHVRI